MKKYGFTLAEVLITMTIIGIVAALTTPSLFHNAHNAQIGPTLAKVKTTIETANEQLMHDEEVGRLSTLWSDLNNDGAAITERYISMLSNHMRLEDNRVEASTTINDYQGNQIDGEFNILLYQEDNQQVNQSVNVDDLAQQIDVNTVEGARIAFIYNANNSLFFVDTNGISGPNRFGRDIFAFILENDGMLRPYGDFDADNNNDPNAAYSWQNLCNPENDVVVSAGNVAAGLACTATIFNNNLRVTYDE